MLFNSYEFIFVFLPVVLLGFFAIGARHWHRGAIAWLVAASLFFYGWWNPAYLLLILASMVFNYAVGTVLGATGGTGQRLRKPVLVMGVAANLAALGYFKYAGFLVVNLNSLLGTHWDLGQILLPLAISFFTFQQIAYLVDAYRGEAREYSFLHYALFVVFFPQLIAGPIVHHKEMLPQFAQPWSYRPRWSHLAVGLTIFAIGLFKKVVIADGIAVYATPQFAAAAQGQVLTFYQAWGGALAYTFQLYFDFSGYSDMAIGLARLFGIRLPLNFHSPYKAVNITDFWRRWHMTLSRFLRDYLYIPLGGNRQGRSRRYINLFLTMVLGGLWHGAGWTFVIWGVLHGLYLIINHAWQALRISVGLAGESRWWGRWLGRLVTFTAVVVAWVFFRAENLAAALNMLSAMAGFNGIGQPDWQDGVVIRQLLPLFIVVWFLPNTQQFMARYRPAFDFRSWRREDILLNRWLCWKPLPVWGAAMAVLLVVAILHLQRNSEFLYFQF